MSPKWLHTIIIIIIIYYRHESEWARIEPGTYEFAYATVCYAMHTTATLTEHRAH